MIPKILHFVWMQGFGQMPAEYRWCFETWRPMHPAWEIRLWTRDNIPPLFNAWVLKRDIPTVQADVVRLEVVRLFGGVYMDCDMQALRPIDPVLKESKAFVSMRNRMTVENSGFGAEKDHPWIVDAVEEFNRSRDHILQVLDADGPFERVVNRHPEIDVYPYTAFHVEMNDRKSMIDEAYSLHHRFALWMREDPRFADGQIPTAFEQQATNPMVEA